MNITDAGQEQERGVINISVEYIKAIIAARMERNLTQKELAEKTGIRQSNISRIENGNCSPTIATLQQLAEGVGKKLYIEFR